MNITVLLADDHAIVREGLRRVLEESGTGIEVIGEATSGLETIQKTDVLQPRVVLMDITMPTLNGLEAARQLKARHPATAVVFLTMHESEEYFLEALRCGADGYIPKSAPSTEVLDAIQSAARGEVYLHQSVTRFLLANFLNRPSQDDADDPYHSLTPREREILSLVGNGLTNQEIGERLVLSPNTVHRHRTSLMQKLGLHNRLELLRYCIRRGLVDPAT
jgi:two-component system response regulator NreC